MCSYRTNVNVSVLFDTFSFQHDLNLSHRTDGAGIYDIAEAVNFSTVECCLECSEFHSHTKKYDE